MRIVIDMQGAQSESRFRGIGRYTMSLAQAIVRNCGEHEIILAASGLFPDTIESIRAAFDRLLPQKNIRVWYAPGPVRECEAGNTWRREAAELVREAFLKSLQPDIIHVSSLFEGYVDDAVTSVCAFDQTTPTVVTLYDLIPLLNPEQYLRPKPDYEQYYLRKIDSLKQASALLGISAFSSEDGCKILGFREDRVFNISTACDPIFKRIEISTRLEMGLRQRYGITRPFVLYTGGGDGRKNLDRLVRAYAILPSSIRKEYQLVLAGKISEVEIRALQETAKVVGLEDDALIFTGYVSDEELVQLYNLCALFVFPSWYEGFGLPVLEAMSCGAPVIAARASSLTEVINWDDALFDPYSETAIAAKLIQALTDNAFNVELVRYGIERARKFSWDESAKRALEAFERVLNGCNPTVRAAMPSALRPKLAYISPLPPERSGIADYSAELLPELLLFYDIEVIVAQPEVSDVWIMGHCPIRTVAWFEQHANYYDRVLYHFGNSPFHLHMFDLLPRFPGVVVLHDFFLSNIQAYRESQEGLSPIAWRLELYQAHGYAAVRERFHAQDAEEVIAKYPCSFSALQGAAGVIAHSTHSVDLARKWYGSGIMGDWKVIPLLRKPIREFDRSFACQKIGLDADDFVICSFGLLDPAKQNHRLLDAWINSELAQDERCYLIFVGQNHGGDYGAQLLNLISQSGLQHRIRITGWADADTFRHYLAAADMAVQLRTLSRGETSAAVLDCMNYGVPTIVNAKGAMAELPSDAVWMLPDEFEDAQLVEALESLWRDVDLRQTLGKRGRETVIVNHEPKACAEQYAAAIENLYTNVQTNRQALIKKIAHLENMPASDDTLVKLAATIAQNQPDKRSAHSLFIDISATCRSDLKTGIERVARALVSELIQTPPKGYRIEPVYLTDEGGCWHYCYARQWTLSTLGCPSDWLSDDLVEFQPQDLLLVADLSGGRMVESERSGVYKQLRDIGVGIYFVVYDLLPIRMPEMFPPGASDIHTKWLAAVNRVADGIIGISQSVMDEFVEQMEVSRTSRLRPLLAGWFHLGADVENSVPTHGLPADAAQTLAQLTVHPCFLMVGTIEPRKGYLQVIDAFTRLWQEGLDINLVIVGNEGWKSLPDDMRRTIPQIVEQLHRHPELGKRLFWLEGISDEYLEKVYAASTCLLAASEGEGFGLPLIEAAQHGLPIIARDIPVFREVAQQEAYYFSGLTGSELAVTIRVWLNLKGKIPMSTKMQWNTWKQAAQKLAAILTGGKHAITFSKQDVNQKAMEEHLNLIHAARVIMVSTLLPHGDYILDLGGANCPLYKMGYPHHFRKLTLIDLPPDQRHDYYKDVVIDSNCPLGPVVVRYTDMTTLEGIADESVDFVWSGQSIEHVPLEVGERMCREAFRVLKKGGAFCLDTPNRRLTEIHTATIGGGFIHPEHFIEYHPEQLTQILKAAGFSIANACGICEMPKTIATGEFHYEDFMLGKQITDRVADGYIQFFHCVKS